MKKINFYFFSAVAAICCLILSTNATAQTREFTSTSLINILEANSNKPFLLVLWSIECGACLAELALIAELTKAHPELNLVLVNTDAFDQQQAHNAILNRLLISHLPSWAFGIAQSAKLKYVIDPEWYGELPRSYFYDETHQRFAISGKLSKDIIGRFFGK